MSVWDKADIIPGRVPNGAFYCKILTSIYRNHAIIGLQFLSNCVDLVRIQAF